MSYTEVQPVTTAYSDSSDQLNSFLLINATEFLLINATEKLAINSNDDEAYSDISAVPTTYSEVTAPAI